MPEILLAAQFAKAQQNIQGIIMNNEQPLATAVARTSYSGGNYVKDLMLQISSNPQTVIDIDIKIGNNAYNVPNGFWAHVLCYLMEKNILFYAIRQYILPVLMTNSSIL